MSIVMYRNDTAPPLTATLSGTLDGTTAPVDLTAATSIKVIAKQRGTVLFSRTVTGTDEGVVVVDWQTGDLAKVGTVVVEFEVTWPGGKIQTFRAADTVSVLADLG